MSTPEPFKQNPHYGPIYDILQFEVLSGLKLAPVITDDMAMGGDRAFKHVLKFLRIITLYETWDELLNGIPKSRLDRGV